MNLNVASARDEISLRKWSGGAAHLRTFIGSIGCKKCVWLAAILFHSCFFAHSINQGWANLFNRRVICRKPKTIEPQNQFLVSIQIWWRMQVLH